MSLGNSYYTKYVTQYRYMLPIQNCVFKKTSGHCMEMISETTEPSYLHNLLNPLRLWPQCMNFETYDLIVKAR